MLSGFQISVDEKDGNPYLSTPEYSIQLSVHIY